MNVKTTTVNHQLTEDTWVTICIFKTTLCHCTDENDTPQMTHNTDISEEA